MNLNNEGYTEGKERVSSIISFVLPFDKEEAAKRCNADSIDEVCELSSRLGTEIHKQVEDGEIEV